MKNNFNFLQLANLIFILKKELLKLNTNSSKEELTKIMKNQKVHLKLFIDVIEKKKKLSGIQKDFLKSLPLIKKELNIEE